MSYLKSTRSNNKAKFPKKRGSTKEGICRHCNEKITLKERLHYSYGGHNKHQCKSCHHSRAKKNYIERKKKIKNYPLW